jgi:hypothetical protein
MADGDGTDGDDDGGVGSIGGNFGPGGSVAPGVTQFGAPSGIGTKAAGATGSYCASP